MSGNPSISNVRHACLTYGIDEITDFEIADGFATFKGTYYHPSHKGETWLFFARSREGGGIDITPVCDISEQRVSATDSSIDPTQETSDPPKAQYNEETLEYLVGACQHLARLQKNLRWHPEFLEEEQKVLDVCFAISRKIDPHLNAKQKEKMNYMFYG
jgi:hypothetical protein